MNHSTLVCVFIATFICVGNTSYSQCNSSGFKFPATVSNNSSSGAFSWSGVTNITSSDNNEATAGYTLGLFASIQSNNLMSQNFNLSIPAAVTICGIEVKVECDADGLGILGTSVKDQTIRLLKGGTMVGTNKANTGAWPTSETTVTYGSNSDLWGTTWTSADINSADFGVAFAVQLNSGALGAFLNADIDAITVNVYYQHIVLAHQVEHFTGTQKNNSVQLNWKLKKGHGLKEIVLERQVSASSWQKMTTISTINDKEEQTDFQVNDLHPFISNNYRLKFTDPAGNNSYSSAINIKVKPVNEVLITLNRQKRLVVVTGSKPLYFCNVYNSYGVLLTSMQNKGGSLQIEIPFTGLPEGYVLINAGTAEHRETKQLFIQH